MSKRLTEIAAEIVQNQVSRGPMSSEEIVASLQDVFGALMLLKKAEREDVSLEEIPPGEAMEATRPGMNPKVVCVKFCKIEQGMRRVSSLSFDSRQTRERAVEGRREWVHP